MRLLFFLRLKFFSYYFNLNSIAVFLLLVGGVVSLFVWAGSRAKTRYLVPRPAQLWVELIYRFIKGILKQQVGVVGFRYLPFIFVTFLFILFSNLLGLIPFGVTVTAQLLITFVLALSFNLGFIFLGLANNGLHFFKIFIPQGAPIFLLPLIVVIEVISYSIRSFSLALRLFANMMAGHTLLHILSAFIFMFLYAGAFAPLAVVPFLLYMAVIVLELGIAFLQAYVFAILLCIYMGDSFGLGH